MNRHSKLVAGFVALLVGLCISTTRTDASPSAAGLLQITSVPPVAGVQFSLSGPLASDGSSFSSPQVFVSDDAGVAQLTVTQAGTYRIEVAAPGEREGERVEFSRWLDEIFSPSREVEITARGFSAGTALQVGFEISRLVDLSLLDLSGRPISWDRVESVTIASSIGQKQTFNGGEQQWVKASRVVRRALGLEVSEIQYSVESAVVAGSNVVNRAQQRFYPSETQEWPVQLLLYSAKISARDAIFGFPIGSGIELIYPDGHIERYDFGPSAELSLESLPRGEYKVKVLGPGYAPPRPVALSRDQVVKLQVISYLDITIMGLAVAVPALALFLIGRPHLLQVLRRRKAVSTSPADQPSAEVH